MLSRRAFIQSAALGVTALSTFTLTGCGEPKRPCDVAVAFVETIYKGDAAGALKYVDLEGAEGPTLKLAEEKISAAAADAKARADKQGGLKDVEAIAKPSEAEVAKGYFRVQVKAAFGNGTSKIEGVKMTKKGETWKVQLGF